jgi:hypothetical protein
MFSALCALIFTIKMHLASYTLSLGSVMVGDPDAVVDGDDDGNGGESRALLGAGPGAPQPLFVLSENGDDDGDGDGDGGGGDGNNDDNGEGGDGGGGVDDVEQEVVYDLTGAAPRLSNGDENVNVVVVGVAHGERVSNGKDKVFDLTNMGPPKPANQSDSNTNESTAAAGDSDVPPTPVRFVVPSLSAGERAARAADRERRESAAAARGMGVSPFNWACGEVGFLFLVFVFVFVFVIVIALYRVHYANYPVHLIQCTYHNLIAHPVCDVLSLLIASITLTVHINPVHITLLTL